MHDPLGVRGLQGARHCLDDRRRVVEWQAAATMDPCAEVLAFEVLEHHVRCAVVGEVEVDDLDDVLVPTRAGDLRLATESIEHLLVRRDLGLEELQRELARHAQVLRLEDGAHTPLAEHARQPVGAGDDRSDALVRDLHAPKSP